MNINSNEMLLFNRKNMNLRNSAPTEITNPIVEPTTTTPESAMKALDMQGKNNIAFLGVKTKAAKSVSKAALMALLTLGAAASTTSCIKDTTIQEVSIDMKAITEMINKMIAFYEQMLEMQKINNEQNQAMLDRLNELYKAVLAGNMSQEEFYKFAVEYMMNDAATQTAIKDSLESQGKTQEEINKKLDYINNLIANGKYQEAMNEILSILKNINQTLDYILEELKMIRDDINKNHEEYMNAQDKQIYLLDQIYSNGMRKEDIDALMKAWAETNASLDKLVDNSDKMLNLSAEQFKALMEEIAGLKPTDKDYAKFEEMFKLLNMNMQDLFNKYLENEAKAREEYLAQGKDFQANVIGNLTKMNELLHELDVKMQNISAYPGLDELHALVEASIAKLTEAINNGATDVTELVKEVINNQNKLLEEVAAMHKELGNVSSKMSTLIDLEKANNKTTQAKLDEVIGSLKDLKGASNITNTLLASINEDTAALLLYADKAVNSADQIVAQGAKIEAAIKALVDATGKDPSEITYEDLEKLLKDQNEDYFKMFTQYMQDSGLANISGDLDTVKDLLISINKNTMYIHGFGVVTKTTKNAHSTRVISVPSNLINLLQEYKVWWDEQKANHGDLWSKTNKLFVRWDGRDMPNATIAGWLKDFQEKNNLKRVSLHGLRHSNITMLISNGVDIKTVSARVGHSDIKTTLNIA